MGELDEGITQEVTLDTFNELPNDCNRAEIETRAKAILGPLWGPAAIGLDCAPATERSN